MSNVFPKVLKLSSEVSGCKALPSSARNCSSYCQLDVKVSNTAQMSTAV